MGLGVFLPHPTPMSHTSLRSCYLGLGGHTVCSAGTWGQQIDLQHTEPCTSAAPLISRVGNRVRMPHPLMDVRKAHCKHQTSVCVCKTHYKHHQEWEKNKASLFTVWEREKQETCQSVCFIIFLYWEGKLPVKIFSFVDDAKLMDLPFGDRCLWLPNGLGRKQAPSFPCQPPGTHQSCFV